MNSTDLERLRDDVALAALVVAPSWPLSSIIAVNPLSGFEDRPFEQALIDGERLFGTRGHLALSEMRAAHTSGRIPGEHLEAAVKHRVGDVTQAELAVLLTDLVHGIDEPAPHRSAVTVAERHDLRHGTRVRAQLDIDIAEWCAEWSTLPDPGDLWRSWRADHHHLPAALPEDVASALLWGLEQLGVPRHAQRSYLECETAALPGWAAHMRWRQEQHGNDTMIGYLAACVVLESVMVDGGSRWVGDGPEAGPAASTLAERSAAVAACMGRADHEAVAETLTRLPSTEREMVWLDAYERSVHDSLLGSMGAEAPGHGRSGDQEPAKAQVVCCIDVRSEGLRRHLERVGPYETYGYAGFFGLAARVHPVTGGAATDQFPVLLQPSVDLHEVPAAGHGAEVEVERLLSHERTTAGMDDAWRAAKYHPIAPLALAEGAGWIAGPVAAARTAMPRLAAWVGDHLPHDRPRSAATSFDLAPLTVEAQAALVAGVLRLGIGRAPAPLVVLCGHDARTDNNPLESGLACGACGGHGGAANARALAAMANDPAVRAAVAETGTTIEDDTWFLAALHDTTTDTVTLLDLDRVPAEHEGAVSDLRSDLDRAGTLAALDRAAMLPGAADPANRRQRSIVQAVRQRGRDWAEPVAELGLAGNMAFVVGPRTLTAGLDLGRRVFLHSYDAAADTDGSTLTGILTAPLIVAQWINAQYYFSTTDPEQFGAGTKAVHNVLGDVGVLSGPSGDLRRGLALQSVRDGDRLLHEPVRLLAVVQGRLDHIDVAIAGSATLARLVENGWIHLVARQDGDHPWQQRTAAGWAPRALTAASEHGVQVQALRGGRRAVRTIGPWRSSASPSNPTATAV